MRCQTLYESGNKRWYLFHPDAELVRRGLGGNTLALTVAGDAVLVDPGGGAIFADLLSALTGIIDLDAIAGIVVSRQGLDVAASLPLWRRVCPAEMRVFSSTLSIDAVRQLDSALHAVGIPDEGGAVPVNGATSLDVLPAPYLHAAESVSLFDSDAGILYSGDVGTAIIDDDLPESPFVTNFDSHIHLMANYHARWMGSDAARDAWLSKIAELNVRFMVPRRGLVFRGADVDRFLDWFSTLNVGNAVPQSLGGASVHDQTPSDSRAKPRKTVKVDFQTPIASVAATRESNVDDIPVENAGAIDLDKSFDELDDEGIGQDAIKSFERLIAGESGEQSEAAVPDVSEPAPVGSTAAVDEETFRALQAAAENVLETYEPESKTNEDERGGADVDEKAV